MSAKSRDEHNRWRNITVGFRVSPEENEQLNEVVALSGLPKQEYLADIDRQAEEMFLRLVKQMAEAEGVTEQLRADKQMEWVGRMNNIRNKAMEMVNTELIYTT